VDRYFNVSGPCVAHKHYMLPAQERCVDLMSLVSREAYFVIHAPRQTGKTTLLLDFADEINRAGKYHALYCSLEIAQGVSDLKEGIPAIVGALSLSIKYSQDLSEAEFGLRTTSGPPTSLLQQSLSDFCARLDRPLILLFDEVDCLSNGTLISFLRQLRNGYVQRVNIPFAHSVALVGMRNIRDYKARVREEGETLRSASPFNIVTKALTIRNFTAEEVAKLYHQHEDATGQAFSDDVVSRVFEQTGGQPWLVNAVAREIVDEILEGDHEHLIETEYVDRAAQTIIRRRDTHIDSLMERLSEERVRRIVEPIITGEGGGIDPLTDDFQYVQDLGLIRQDDKGLMAANPIYADVIVRTLNSRSEFEFSGEVYGVNAPRYLEGDRLNMRKLLSEFQEFWRENSEIWIERYQYKEAAPHLVLTAFFQRIVNAGGQISREYAAGKGRMDICVHFKGHDYPIEIKLWRGDKTVTSGREQLARYLDSLGTSEGWLVIFDRRPDIPWDQKISWETESAGERVIHLVGC
jgi:hypothetical protein